MSADPIIQIQGLRKVFAAKRSLVDVALRRQPDQLTAVDGVDLAVAPGETLGIVGESGCGKTTLARCLVGLYSTTEGRILFEGRHLEAQRSLADRRRMQIVFQDPYSSLNARMTIGQALAEALRVHGIASHNDVDARVAELLELVGLTPALGKVRPGELSGGQRQRVSIARALAVQPDVLVADEPVSALDVSVQATVLNLLADLRDRLGLTLLLIAHDLSVVRYLCDRVAVMYLGRIVEIGATETVFAQPRHPYTAGLLAAAPTLKRREDSSDPAVGGDPPSPYEIPAGCRFHSRCRYVQEHCRTEDPTLRPGPSEPERHSACHYAWPDRGGTPSWRDQDPADLSNLSHGMSEEDTS